MKNRASEHGPEEWSQQNRYCGVTEDVRHVPPSDELRCQIVPIEQLESALCFIGLSFWFGGCAFMIFLILSSLQGR